MLVLLCSNYRYICCLKSVKLQTLLIWHFSYTIITPLMETNCIHLHYEYERRGYLKPGTIFKTEKMSYYQISNLCAIGICNMFHRICKGIIVIYFVILVTLWIPNVCISSIQPYLSAFVNGTGAIMYGIHDCTSATKLTLIDIFESTKH